MKKIIFFLLTFLFLLIISGCTHKIIYQIDGQPVVNNIITANILSEDIKIKYVLIKNLVETEGKEKYKTYDYLNIIESEVIELTGDSDLEMKIYIFNPKKNYYQLFNKITMGGRNYNALVYKGNLSRNELKIVLPLKANELINYQFKVFDDDNNVIYQSFDVKYKK
jgi:hypothetical protein